MNALQIFGGTIDILISNAAVNPFAGPLLETPDEALDKILEVGCIDTFRSSAASCMLKSGHATYRHVTPVTVFVT